eukprot:3339236-Rhodomonas_salina.2
MWSVVFVSTGFPVSHQSLRLHTICPGISVDLRSQSWCMFLGGWNLRHVSSFHPSVPGFPVAAISALSVAVSAGHRNRAFWSAWGHCTHPSIGHWGCVKWNIGGTVSADMPAIT